MRGHGSQWRPLEKSTEEVFKQEIVSKWTQMAQLIPVTLKSLDIQISLHLKIWTFINPVLHSLTFWSMVLSNHCSYTSIASIDFWSCSVTTYYLVRRLLYEMFINANVIKVIINVWMGRAFLNCACHWLFIDMWCINGSPKILLWFSNVSEDNNMLFTCELNSENRMWNSKNHIFFSQSPSSLCDEAELRGVK